MALFLRYLLLTSYLMIVCHGQLKNLRPLKGILNDFDGPRNATEERLDDRPPPILFAQASPGQGIISGGFGGGSSGGLGGGSSVGFGGVSSVSFGGSSGGAFSHLPPSRPTIAQAFMPPVEISIQQGVSLSTQQINQQRNRPASEELELSSRFLSAFRRAEKEAEEASCVGRALIETTKQRAERLAVPLSDAIRILTNTEIDETMCMNILKEGGCEDFHEPPPCSETETYRRMDGSCNNLQNPKWGRASSPFTRFLYPDYENGIDSMRGEGRKGPNRLPSARTVSYNLQKIRQNPPLFHISLMLMQWGQFVDHDITFTAETQIERTKRRSDFSGTSSMTGFLTNTNQIIQSCPMDTDETSDTVPLECCPHGNPVDDSQLTDCRPIDVSADPLFIQENRKCMRFVRSLIASKGCLLGPREQLNQITAYIDGSAVYGSSHKVSQILRKKRGGHLQKTDHGNLLPRNCCEDRTFSCFKAGDTRVNEQPGLTSMHTLWLRVHEQIVMDFAAENPQWDDETLFQEARRVVIALIQQTTYREWLPLVLGPEAMIEEDLELLPNGPSATYDPEEDASVANVVATAAFRFGHTLVNDALRGAGGEAIPLVGNFENAKALFQSNTRPSAILQGLAFSNSQAPDSQLVQTLTNRLFAPPEERIGLDLMSLNIQRGRDHGLPPYAAWRTACQLPSFTSFDELASVMPAEVIQIFRNSYSDVGEIDLFPASLSEFPVDGGLVGPTFACLISQQFSRLKKGDRFFFQNVMQPKPFRPDQLQSISQLTLASIICRHSDIDAIQPNVFLSAGINGNDLRPCFSYPRLDTSLWRENGSPPPPGYLPPLMTSPAQPGVYGRRQGLSNWSIKKAELVGRWWL